MSIGCRLFLICVLILSSASLFAQQETERHYRVELIVLRHLAGSSDSTPQPELRDLSEVLDLNAPPPVFPPDFVAKPAEPVQSVKAGDEAEDLETGELPEPEEPEEPLAVRVDEMSDTMRETWRRLRGSAGFRPELFRAWEQSGDEPFPVLRIHDDEILFQVAPVDPRSDVPVDEYGALVFTDETLQQRPQEESDGEVSAAKELLPPQPSYYFRVDGTANLTRSRFLHLDLDIELREPLFDPAYSQQHTDGQPISPAPPLDSDADAMTGMVVDELALLPDPPLKSGPAADASAFRVHHIRQRRQVKTEQMEYFDGPVIGVLALITGFDVIPEDDTAGDVSLEMDSDTELAE